MAGPSSKRSKASRFPAARIKKIMQMDEDVGKLASATPVMISKSLECFMQKILDEAAKEAKSRGSKKLTAYHLKHTINNTPSFDFLLDIVSKVPDPVHTTPSESTPSGLSRRKPSSAGQSSQPRQTSGSGPPASGRKRKAKAPVSASGPESSVGMLKREEEDDDYDQEDNYEEEDMERYRSRQPVRPGIGNLLNPTEEKKVEKKEKGVEGGAGGAARGMFDDYDDDDDY